MHDRLPLRRTGRRSLRLDQASELGRGGNNFDLLRLLGAGLVLFAHSFALVGAAGPFHPLRDSWGSLGVLIFFSISGFLVARSWSFDPRPLSFAFKRALRLLPALIVSLLLTALLLGPLVSTLPLHLYLEDPGTKAFVINNATMQTTYGLPGVFAANVYPAVVNGSLWTLPLEVKAYCLVAVLGLLGLYGRRRLLMPLVGLVVALLLVASIRNALPLGNRFTAMLVYVQAGPEALANAKAGAYDAWAQPFAAFAIGATMFSLARWISLRWSIAALLTGIWIVAVAKGGHVQTITTAWIAPYVVLIVAYRTAHLFRLPDRVGDYSYGLYIYAFPVQQTISHLLSPSSGWVMLLLSAPITLLFAIASWHLVEAPALTLKQRLVRPLAVASHKALHPSERTDLDATPVGDVSAAEPARP